jgi:endoglucanase
MAYTPTLVLIDPMRRLGRVLMLLSTLALPAIGITPVQYHGALKVQGNKILNQAGQPVRFDGMALFWSQWQPQYYNESCIRWLAEDWKCGIIRASMAIEDGGFLANPQGEIAKVKRVIEAAIATGLYVVVDWHDHNAHSHLDAARSFFADIAKTYGHAPNIIYETFNEPWEGQGWIESIKPYHEKIILEIRKHDPDNLILLGTPRWSQDVDIASENPVTLSANLIYTLHYYAATHRQVYREKAEKALKNGLALMVTEGGLSEANGNGRIDTLEARKWLRFMRENSISWMNWSVCDKYESSAALNQGASGSGGWGDGNLTPSGRWVRAAIRSSYTDGTRIAGEGVSKAEGKGGFRRIRRNGAVLTFALPDASDHGFNALGLTLER